MLSNLNISISDFCKNNHIKRTEFIKFLTEQKYIYTQFYGKNKVQRKNIAYTEFTTNGGNDLFEMNERENSFNNCYKNINIQITPKGQNFFKDLLTKGENNGNIKH